MGYYYKDCCQSVADEHQIRIEALLEACRYALKFIEEDCPKFDQIHTRTMLETALNATQR